MSSEFVSTSVEGRVLVCRIDDGKVNALSREMIAAVSEAIDTAENSAEIGAVALLGRAGKFSAGFDLGVMRGGDPRAVVELVADGGALVRRLYGSSVPVVAGCHGHAIAAGALILLGCDVRLAADVPCKIGLNEVAIGMRLPDWAFTIARHRLTPAALDEAVACATLYDATGACRAGYVDAVVGPDELETEVRRRASELAELHPTAYAATVDVLRSATLAALDEQIASDRAHGASIVI